MEKLLTMTEAAEICGIPLRTWYAKYRTWEVPHFRLGKHIMFRLSELNAWIETQRG